MAHFLISSDWHLNHSNDTGIKGILAFERGKKFQNIEEHDEYIVDCIQRWAGKLNKDDTFYFLGDFGKPTEKTFWKLHDIFRTLKCRTIAIKGNHDHEQEIEQMEQLFDEVSDVPLFINKRVVLSHHPYPQMSSVLNVSGHLHGSTLDLPNYLCASIHVANYQAISDQMVNNALSKINKWDMRFLWEPFAEHYKFTQKKEDCVYDKNGCIDLAASRALQRLRQQQPCGNE